MFQSPRLRARIGTGESRVERSPPLTLICSRQEVLTCALCVTRQSIVRKLALWHEGMGCVCMEARGGERKRLI